MAAQPAGERRIVSVLMADVAGSTAIGEALGPERSKFLFDEVVRLMAEEVRRFGGTVAQLTGDGLFALFGAPSAHEDDSERAVRAGLAVQGVLAGYTRELEQAYGVAVAARIGINTGPIVLMADDVPPEERYNALGDTANVAARLQALAGEGGVALGPTTARQVEGSFELEGLGEVELKGKGASVAAFRVAGERGPTPHEPALTPFVGREPELAALDETLAELARGGGAIVSITGEPGIGKSRLVSEARERYEGRVRFLEGHAAAYAESFPYWPVRDLLRCWLGLSVFDRDARARLELKAQLAAVLTDEAERVYPFLATVLGVSVDPETERRLHELSRDSVQRQTFEAVTELLCGLAREQPLCLLLEDLHWADETTLQLVEQLLALTEDEALVALLLYRSEREHRAWQLGELARKRFPHRYRELELGPLAPDEALGLAEAELPEAVAELLVERSGGNPFFLEEALRDLVERGALRRESGGYELAVSLDELSVPVLVQEALQARLGRLSPETRELVGVASVIGRNFALPLLERVVPERRLSPGLSELQRLELVVEERRRPAREYRFRHGLVQEAAYATLLESSRRTLHRSVGEALEELTREAPQEAFTLLARHFAEADEPERAAGYLLKAGDAARGIDSEEEALDHYRRALMFLERLGDERRSRDTLLKIALTHHLAFDFEQADRAYGEAFARRVPVRRSLELTDVLETALGPLLGIAPGYAYNVDSYDFVGQLFAGLLAIGQDLNVVPSLAESLRVSSDGLTYRFRLREDARWSDGTPVTAGDFSYSWRRMLDERVRTAHLLANIDSADAVDERTLEICLREPRAEFLYLLTIPTLFPWPRHVCEDLGDKWRTPENLVGSGPFQLAEFDERHAVLAANPHWALWRGNVSRVDVGFQDHQETRLESWRAGRYDLLAYFGEFSPGPETVSESIPWFASSFVAFRSDAPPFDDARVRRAFSHAVDRVPLAEEWGDEPATKGGLIPPAMPAHSHRAGLPYDLELARRLLAEAGYPGGEGLPELTLASPYSSQGRTLAEQWAALGARVRLEILPPDRQGAERAHMYSDGWNADYPDPDSFLRGFVGGLRISLYTDDRIESLLRKAGSLADRKGRIRLYNEVERLWITEQAALVPLFYPRRTVLRRPWIEGLKPRPLFGVPLDQLVVRRP